MSPRGPGMLVYKYTWPLTDPGLGKGKGGEGGEGKRREKGTGMPALTVLPPQNHEEKVEKTKKSSGGWERHASP